MTSPFVEPLSKRKRKKGPDDEIIKNVVVLKSSQVREKDGVVLMPKTTLDMSGIKKLGQSRKITFTKSTSSGDLQRKLEEKFPFLREASGRFYCAKAVENRSKLDFCGDRCVWSGAFINKNITGNSALYIYCEEEKEGDSGHYSSDPDLPGAPVYGNCLVTAAPQGRKRFGSEPCPAAEGLIDKETLRAVESQTCGTVRESDRNYRPFGQPEGVKTQVIKKEASACALTVGREAAEEEQIQDQNPNTWLLTLQPTLLLSDLLEQTNPSTLAPLLESLQVSCKDIEIQKSYDQASTETFTAKGSQSAQQNTPLTVGDSNNQITEEIASLQNEIYDGSISLADNDFPPQNLRDLESIKQWLKQYDVSINPRESPLQGGGPCIFTFKPELPSDVGVKASFGNLEPIILEKTSLGYICKIPASPKMTPEVIPVRLISMTTGEILAETSLEYCGVLYVRKNFGGKPGACGSGRREDGSSDGGASGGGASGGRSSGGRSSGEGASGSGVSGDGTGGTGAGGCGGKGCGTYGGGATGCQYRIDASQLGSDVVSKLCDLMQKCSVGIQRQEPSATQNKACTEAEEDSEDDQLSCTQESNENYFADTEDCSSVSSETDSALSDSESWDESLRDSPLSFPWVNSRSSKSQEAILETESTQHSREAVYSKLNVSHEIQELMTEGFTSEDSIGNNNYVGSGVCHKWNTSLPESKKTEENCEKDDHNKMQDSSQEWAFFSEGRTSHIQLASHDNTPLLCLDALDLIVENEESQYQDNELFEAPHAENAKPKDSESILSVTSNQQSATHAGPTTQSQAAQSPVSNPLWNGDSQLNMAPPQCSDEEIHSGQEWEESGEGLASWFDLCENEDAGKNEHSKWEMPSIEPNKTDGGVEKDIFDSEEDLSREQGLLSEQRNLRIRLSLPVVTPVCGFGIPHPFVNPFMMFHKDTPLSGAARYGHTDIVRLLIEKGADVNKRRGHTTLFEAARSGNTDIVRLLIENGADVNKGRGYTPLFEAARNGHTDIVRLLLENGADVNKGGGDTPLSGAARYGHTDIVRLLIEKGADVNKGRGDTPLFKAARYGHTAIDTPLSWAARNGQTTILWLLIENGDNVNKGLDTPLSEAARYGHTDIVRLLIEKGADVNKDTPLFKAARYGHTAIVRLLLENGADIFDGRGNTKLSWAARNGQTNIVRLLIENGADVNKGRGYTPLFEAARNGHTDIVRLLLENGADVNKGGEDTPLLKAARNGHTDIVRLLLENGADINKGLYAPLSWALTNGYSIIERLFIEIKADVNKGRGDTPLSGAARNGHTDIVRLLIEKGADVNKDTSLLKAARYGHIDIVRLLLENGADVNKGRGNFPLCAAARNGHTDIVRLLIESGADVKKGGGFYSLNPLQQALEIGHSDIVKLLVDNGADFKVATLFDTMMMKLFEESLRRKFEADARDTKLSLERVLDVQLRGKKIASLPKRLGKKLTTQTEMTSPRDIVEEGKCGKDSMTDVELGLNCLHLSPRCVQFKPFIMEESPGDSSIMHHDFKTINKRMDRVTLTDVGNAKQDHCVVVEKAKTHPNGDTIIIYGRKINEEGSSLGEVFHLATKDLKDAWEDEEMVAENVEIGSVVKYVQVGDDFLFQGNTKRPRWDKDRIFLGLSCTDGAHRGIGNAFPNSKRIEKDRYEGCTPKETSYFISLKCGVVENDRISVITKLGELFNLKLNCREDVILPLSPSTLELSLVEDNKDVVDGAVVEIEEPLLISGVDSLSKPSYPVLGEGLNLRDEPKEKSVEAENPEADPEEKDNENGNTF